MKIITCPVCESVRVKNLKEDQIQCIICGHIGTKDRFEKNLRDREIRHLNDKFKDDRSLFITLCKELKDMVDFISPDDLKVINKKLILMKANIR